MSPDSTRVCRDDTLTMGCVSPPTSPLCLWDSRAHLGVHSRRTTGAHQAWHRPGTQQLLQETGSEGAPVGVHMGTLGHFAARPFNLSLLKIPFTIKQPHSPLADLQGPRLGSKPPPFPCFPEIPSRVLRPLWQGTGEDGAEPQDQPRAGRVQRPWQTLGGWPPGLSQRGGRSAGSL